DLHGRPTESRGEPAIGMSDDPAGMTVCSPIGTLVLSWSAYRALRQRVDCSTEEPPGSELRTKVALTQGLHLRVDSANARTESSGRAGPAPENTLYVTGPRSASLVLFQLT